MSSLEPPVLMYHMGAMRTPMTEPSATSAPSLASIQSVESGRSYRLERLIGKGGVGGGDLATPAPRIGAAPPVCVKISDRLSAWLREAYFADLLRGQPRALRVFDCFPIVDGLRMRYCLAMEYARHGDLGQWLAEQGPQSERFVRREIAAILGTLDALHRGQALHRD